MIKRLILRFWFWLFPKQIINEVNNKLENALDNKKDLLFRIRHFLLIEYGIGSTSKYIPKSYKEREKIVNNVHTKFGEEMTKFGIILNNKLQFKRV